ncbi:MAG: dihydropteroate synthase [Maricaulaceae bacterium]
MGVVNLTPDSFSDGGQFANGTAARDHALRLLDAGADWLDLGGESTRPGAAPVSEAEELARVLPVLEAILTARPTALMSIDTMKPGVARAAVQAGARMWNDVTALRFAPESLETAAELGVETVLMHMQGAPQTMQANPHYDNVVTEVIGFLQARVAAARAAGIPTERLWVDPGIGFGKTLAHNLALMAATERIIAETGRPLLFGASRKRFIAALDPSEPSAERRLGGSLAAALYAARAGARMVRVHDVAETVQALKVQAAILADDGRREPG